MPSKKELLKRIEDLEARITRLENMHANVILGRNWERPFDVHHGALWETADGRIGFYGDRQLTAREVQYQSRHPQPKQVDYRCLTNVPSTVANTENINDVTLEELTRYVLDGTPITRETKEPVTYVTEHSPESITNKVCTRLGDITMIEKADKAAH